MTQSKRFTKGLSRRYYSGRTRKRPEGAVRRGSLELCTTTRLIGWAIEDDQPGVLEVFVGEERVAGIRCDRPRPDLAEIGARTDAGFAFVFRQPIPTSQSVRVCFADGTLLENTPATPTRYESSIDACTIERVSGWAVCDGQPAEIEILVNGGLTARVHCVGPRPDLASAGLAPDSGFEFVFPRGLTEADEVSIRFADGTRLAGSPRRPTGAEVQPASRAGRDESSDREVEFTRSLLSSDFVDNELFLKALGGGKDDLQAVALYLSLPSGARPDVSWFFDRRFYLDTYSDVAAGDADPLLHFIRFGVKELRSPHPLIDPQYIRKHHSDLLPSPPSVQDLLSAIESDSVDPSTRFSLEYYRDQLADTAIKPVGLLRHFLQSGILSGLRPVPGFDVLAYYGEIDEKDFDIRSVLRATALKNPRSASLAALPLSGQPAQISPQFRIDRALNPLSKAAYQQALLDHRKTVSTRIEDLETIINAMKSQQDAETEKLYRNMRTITESGLFDEEFYIATYPNVEGAEVDPLEHYVRHGDLEGLCPNPFFSPTYYRRLFLAGSPGVDCPSSEFLRQRAS